MTSFDTVALHCWNDVMSQLVVFYRVLVTGVLADRSPVELHFFRNFYPPGHELDKETKKFQPPPSPDGK